EWHGVHELEHFECILSHEPSPPGGTERLTVFTAAMIPGSLSKLLVVSAENPLGDAFDAPIVKLKGDFVIRCGLVVQHEDKQASLLSLSKLGDRICNVVIGNRDGLDRMVSPS